MFQQKDFAIENDTNHTSSTSIRLQCRVGIEKEEELTASSNSCITGIHKCILEIQDLGFGVFLVFIHLFVCLFME